MYNVQFTMLTDESVSLRLNVNGLYKEKDNSIPSKTSGMPAMYVTTQFKWQLVGDTSWK